MGVKLQGFFSVCRTARYFIVDFISVPCLNHPIVIQLVMVSTAATCCSSCECLCMCVRLLDKMHATCSSVHPPHTKLPGCDVTGGGYLDGFNRERNKTLVFLCTSECVRCMFTLISGLSLRQHNVTYT